MAMETSKGDVKMMFENYDYVEVDLVEELLCVGKEIKRVKKIIIEEVKFKEKLSQNLEKEEKMVIDLKIQVEEAKRVEEVMKERLLTRNNNYEKLETKIVSLRKDLEKLNHQIKLKFEKSTKILDQIIEIQRPPHINTIIIFTNIQKNRVTKQSMKSVGESLEEKGSRSSKFEQVVATKEIKLMDDGFTQVHRQNRRSRRQAPRGQEYNTKFNHSFVDCFFNYNHFGHESIYCRNILAIKNNFVSKNVFAPLFDFNIFYHKCKNFGHIARSCRSNFVSPPMLDTKRNNTPCQSSEIENIWKKKPEEERSEKSMVAQTILHAQKEENLWIIDNRCSSHMTRDKSQFMYFKKFDGGAITLGNKSISKIIDKYIES